MFVIGLIIGGVISAKYLIPEQTIDLNPVTVKELTELGFSNSRFSGFSVGVIRSLSSSHRSVL